LTTGLSARETCGNGIADDGTILEKTTAMDKPTVAILAIHLFIRFDSLVILDNRLTRRH